MEIHEDRSQIRTTQGRLAAALPDRGRAPGAGSCRLVGVMGMLVFTYGRRNSWTAPRGMNPADSSARTLAALPGATAASTS